MRLLSWLITIPLAGIMVVFAIANRHLVDISTGPLGDSIRMPLFIPVLLALLIGFLLGSLSTWLSCMIRTSLPKNRNRSRTARDLAVLRDDIIRDDHKANAPKE
ncbi:MAG TPA: hypothetical protein DCW68_00355 [Rhodospirillaceae bacterium]|nr:MAG: hypothetical protein A2018_01670 [Alphaproteobacteria bacterium GWF2_58_20]HAU28552.1 hypothetical protein [Rhodospirillaceae bacterium]